MTTTPYYKGSTTEQYDSVVNNIKHPSIYVVFHNTVAYPEYIFKYAVK